jgi:glutamate 5-kinase
MQDLVRQEIATLATLVVVKVGTRVLTASDGTLDIQRIHDLSLQIHRLRQSGRQVVLVSSGAVGAGMSQLGLKARPRGLAQLQAVAAVGQTKLIEAYDSTLRKYDAHAAQVLLTAEDLSDRSRYLNVRNTLLTLLEMNAVPIVNENDTVAVDELMTTFGDNDRLAALVTNALRAPLLIILSDVEGLYDGPPSHPDSRVISTVQRVDDSVHRLVADSANSLSKGGMKSKINAARMATKAGEVVIIASGREPNVLPRLLAGEPLGTAFLAEGKMVSPWKRWIGFSVRTRGSLTLDAGACQAIVRDGRSLLAIGVCGVEGEFEKGDAVMLCDADGRETARGLTNYASADVRRILGVRSDRIAELLGHCPYDEVVHRDNMIVTRSGD